MENKRLSFGDTIGLLHQAKVKKLKDNTKLICFSPTWKYFIIFNLLATSFGR